MAVLRGLEEKKAYTYRWFCDTTNSQQKQVLSEDTKNMFLAKEFVSIEFSDLSSQQEEDLFARVQMGIQLSAAEKMRATTGPWQELAKLFVNDFPAVYLLMKDRNRGKDFQLTLSCFSQIIEAMNPSAASGIPVLKTSHTVLPKLLNNKGVVDDAIKSQLASIWNTFTSLIRHDPSTFTNDNLYLKGVQTFAPVEMVAVTVLISIHPKGRDNHLLLGNIRALRMALRECFSDLRLNTNLWKFIWGSIGNLQAEPLDRKGRSTNEDLPPQPSTSASSIPTPIPRSAIHTKSSIEKTISTAQVGTRVVPSQSTSYASKREGENSGSSSTRIAQKRQRLIGDLPNKSSGPGNKFAETGHVTRQPNREALSAKSPVAPDDPVRGKTFTENEYAVFQAISNMAPALQSAPAPAMSLGITQSPKKILESVPKVAPNLTRPARKGLQATCTASNFTISNPSKETFSLLQSQPSERTGMNKSSHLPVNDVPINPVSFGSQYSALPPTTQIGKISGSDLPSLRPPIPSSTTSLQGGQSGRKKSTFQAGLGAFNSFYNEDQWSGVLRSPSPQKPASSQSKALLFNELHSSIIGSSASTGHSQQSLPETKSRKSQTLLDSTKPLDFVDLIGETEN